MDNFHDVIRSTGPVTLRGQVEISGSKNASLPLLAATLLCEGPVVFKNIPRLVDIGILTGLLTALGSNVCWMNKAVSLEHSHQLPTTIDSLLANKIRGSILLLGPLLARYGSVQLPMPGGCPIGKRPIDYHLQALEQLGANFRVTPDAVYGYAPNGLKGTTIRFPKPTVTGTENLIMAACLAKGTTCLHECAIDPEVDELIRFLNFAGAMIERQGTTIVIEGQPSLLRSPEPFIIAADRMEVGSFIAACGITMGSVELLYERCPGLESINEHCLRMGFKLTSTPRGLLVDAQHMLKACSFVTQPHPGFPTDLQAPFMALNCVSEGSSIVEERIWENRFFHAEEFIKLGVPLVIRGNQVVITGTRNLQGTILSAQDLRGGCALLLISLAARGQSVLLNNHHLDRGYEYMVNKLNALGANLQREYCSDQDLQKHRMQAACLVA